VVDCNLLGYRPRPIAIVFVVKNAIVLLPTRLLICNTNYFSFVLKTVLGVGGHNLIAVCISGSRTKIKACAIKHGNMKKAVLSQGEPRDAALNFDMCRILLLHAVRSAVTATAELLVGR